MSIIDKLAKKFNETDVVKFSDKNIFRDMKVWIQTGSPELEFNLGTLGFPVGITEIAGKSRSGKTTMALMGMKYFQKEFPDGVCIILSSENRDNKMYAEQIGIDTKKVLIVKSKFVEDLFFKLQSILDDVSDLWREEKLAGRPKIFIFWDSIGGTLARAEAETFRENVRLTIKASEKELKGERVTKEDEKMKHAQMAAFSKQAKMCVKNLLGQIYEKDIVFVALNHTGANFTGHGRKSYGGEWVEYLPCLRLETTLIEHEKLDDVEVGQYTKVKVVKNDFGSRQVTIIEILLGYGIVLSENDIEYAVKKGILKQESKTKFSFFNDKMTWKSKREFYNLYRNGDKFLPILYKKIKDARHKDVLASKGIEVD